VTLDRAEIGALCVRMDVTAERLHRRVKNARALSHLTVSVTADELETMAKQLAAMSQLARKAHDLLRREEIRTRPSEPISISG
jgi:hypothetical protein